MAAPSVLPLTDFLTAYPLTPIMKIQTALISVSDKSGVVPFAQSLHQRGVRLLSTGGTAKLLTEAGLPVTEVATHTGSPEILDGRVKTLHPKIHGGLLARRDTPEHIDTLEEHDIDRIDLLVVNLYPFRETVAKPDCSFDEAVENIDIGGPAMLRAAAKNHGNDAGGVTVVIDPLTTSACSLTWTSTATAQAIACDLNWPPRFMHTPVPMTAQLPLIFQA